MPKFRKKPVVIEAVQFDPATNNFAATAPAEFRKAVCDHDCPDGVPMGGLHIHTLEGPHRVAPGDWIIKGLKGEFYPCKPDVFTATYESVGDSVADDAGWMPSVKQLIEAMRSEGFSGREAADAAEHVLWKLQREQEEACGSSKNAS